MTRLDAILNLLFDDEPTPAPEWVRQLVGERVAGLAESRLLPLALSDPCWLGSAAVGAMVGRLWLDGAAHELRLERVAPGGSLRLTGLPVDWTAHSLTLGRFIAGSLPAFEYRHDAQGGGAARLAAGETGRRPSSWQLVSNHTKLTCLWDPKKLAEAGTFAFDFNAAIPPHRPRSLMLDLEVPSYPRQFRSIELEMPDPEERDRWAGFEELRLYKPESRNAAWVLRVRPPVLADWLDGRADGGVPAESVAPEFAAPCRPLGAGAFEVVTLTWINRPSAHEPATVFVRVGPAKEAATKQTADPEQVAQVKELIEFHLLRLQGYVASQLHLPKDSMEVLEVVSGVCEAALRKPDTVLQGVAFFPKRKEFPYFLTMAVREIAQRVRTERGRGRVRRQQQQVDREELEALRVAREEVPSTWPAISAAIERLPGPIREAAWFRALGLSRKEFARLTGRTEGSVTEAWKKSLPLLKCDPELLALYGDESEDGR